MAAQHERVLLSEILLRLRAGGYPIICTATPNGLHIPARTADEQKIKARIIARMRGDGMLVNGFPDLCLVWRGGGALVELKRPTGRDLFGAHPSGQASPDQLEFAAHARRLGINHAFCRSWDGLVERLRDWGAFT